MRVLGLLALIASTTIALPGHAEALYRCNGSHGETVFTSHPSEYRACKWVSGSREAPHPQKLAALELKPVMPEPASLVVSAAASDAPAQSAPVAKANPAVIHVMPLAAASAPVVRTLPSPDAQVLAIGKPWPMAVMDAIATGLMPKLLGVSTNKPPPAASASAPLTPPAQAAVATSPPVQPQIAELPRAPTHGAVYKIARADGSVEYTNIIARAQGAHATMLFTYIISCYACNVHSRVDWNSVALHLNQYGDQIHTAASQNGVGEALLRAVIHAESGFNPRALSYKGAQGLMQLMPATAADLGVSNAFDVAQNIQGGARYLAQLLHDFHGDVRLAAAAYNAGEAAVRKYNGVPPYDETQVYVKRVAILRDRYLKALHPTALAATGMQ